MAQKLDIFIEVHEPKTYKMPKFESLAMVIILQFCAFMDHFWAP